MRKVCPMQGKVHMGWSPQQTCKSVQSWWNKNRIENGKVKPHTSSLWRAADVQKTGIAWIQHEVTKRGTQVCHRLIGHSRERWVEGSPVVGSHKVTNKVLQFHGCHWHRCPQCFQKVEERVMEEMTEWEDVPEVSANGNTMFTVADEMKLLDIVNHLPPGTD